MNGTNLRVILCFILLFCILVPINQSKNIDREEKTISISENDDIYFFACAFVMGRYDNSFKWITYFRIQNTDYSKKTMYVLGYAPYLPEKLFFVKAFDVQGSFRIGFIGLNHCLIFAFGPGGVTVSGVK